MCLDCVRGARDEPSTSSSGANGESTQSATGRRIAAAGPPHSDPQPQELLRAESRASERRPL